MEATAPDLTVGLVTHLGLGGQFSNTFPFCITCTKEKRGGGGGSRCHVTKKGGYDVIILPCTGNTGKTTKNNEIWNLIY